MITVLSPVVKIRKGPGTAAGIIREAKIGQQFEHVQIIDNPQGLEQWAKIILPDQQDVDAYICVKLPSGKALCEVSNLPAGQTDNGSEYQRGLVDGRRDILVRTIDFLKNEYLKNEQA